ncbi:MAG TPA: MBL fold metallo-hydrolase, partial [Thermococcus litoralis]|nr:MBL fold metallo-hydrolase [Thermococcus litoralis]
MDVGKVDKLRIYVLAEDYAGYNSPFLAQHGISFLIEVKFNGNRRRVLFDVGSYAEPLLFNMKLLSIDPKNIDMIVLSHSHFDHTGGLLGIMKEIGKEIPIFAHPNIFKVSFATEPEFTYAGIPPLRGGSKEEIEKLGGVWVLSRDPIRLMP